MCVCVCARARGCVCICVSVARLCACCVHLCVYQSVKCNVFGSNIVQVPLQEQTKNIDLRPRYSLRLSLEIIGSFAIRATRIGLEREALLLIATRTVPSFVPCFSGQIVFSKCTSFFFFFFGGV